MICHTPGHAEGHSFNKIHASVYVVVPEKMYNRIFVEWKCTWCLSKSWSPKSCSKLLWNEMLHISGMLAGHSSHIKNMCICTHEGEVFELDLCGIQMYMLPAETMAHISSSHASRRMSWQCISTCNVQYHKFSFATSHVHQFIAGTLSYKLYLHNVLHSLTKIWQYFAFMYFTFIQPFFCNWQYLHIYVLYIHKQQCFAFDDMHT
jgi:hypothetical protein